MKPIYFEGANMILAKPSAMTDEQCAPLPVARDEQHNIYVSCWQLSWHDLWRVIRTRRIWLWTAGSNHPPVALDTNTPTIAS